MSVAKLDPGPIPGSLQHLNTIEINIISLVHPYMILLKLPVGGQYAQTGQCINLPVPMQTICSQLPYSSTESCIVINSPKPDRPSHKIDTHKVFSALAWLKDNNPLYANGGFSGGAMVLGKLPVPRRPTILITVGQGPTALAVGAGGGLFGHFYSHLSFLSSFSLSLGAGPI